MATTTTKPEIEAETPFATDSVRTPRSSPRSDSAATADSEADQKPSQRDALQALLAFSALHDQVRRRQSLAARTQGFDSGARSPEFEPSQQFVLDEVLRLVAERAVAITGADGLAIALAENNEIVLRAAAGAIRPDVGARIDRDSAFSGACFRSAQTVVCDDTETDARVNLEACRKLGARSMVAVPLCGRRRVIGVLEAFSEWPFAFNESDVRNLTLLAELVLGALKPEDEDRFAESAQTAATNLESAPDAKTAPVTVDAAKLQPQKTQTLAIEPVTIVRAKQAAVAPTLPVIGPNPASAVVEKAASRAIASIEPVAVEAVPSAARIALEEAEPGKRRPLALILFVCLVIGSTLTAAAWWKMKSAQLGGAIIDSDVHSEKLPASPDTPAEPKEKANAPAATANPIDANRSVQSDSDASEPDTAPANAQELSKFPRVTGIRRWSSADSSTVVLDLEDQVQYEAHRITGPDRVYVDLRDTQLAPELVGKVIDVGDTFVSRIRMAQPVAGMTRIVLETRANSTFAVSLEPNPYRLVIEVRKIGAMPKTAVDLFPTAGSEAKSTMAIVIPPPTKEDLLLRPRVPKMRIVVDAGHGGWDLGTVGRRGLLEKDLVLEIAQRLGKLLESRLGSEVIYTRADDNYISLDDRATVANQAQADLFVSVHANYSDLPSARGVETYYTNFFSAPGSREAARSGAKASDLKAASSPASGSLVKTVTAPTLSPADLHERIEQSRRLAASVQRSLYGTLSVENPGLRDRGIKEAGFVVLTESAMPGILAEVSFVSSPTDEQKLRSDGYREQIAEALYRGIARYAASSKGVKVAGVGK